ncbi:hypothetical protein GGR54DRAFT_529089 [Hypoxylon sp. NC1633]|nr:hypothetical protein GGR54DRAFT_529089 [Hypoxylon sp. NC1633]
MAIAMCYGNSWYRFIETAHLPTHSSCVKGPEFSLLAISFIHSSTSDLGRATTKILTPSVPPLVSTSKRPLDILGVRWPIRYEGPITAPFVVCLSQHELEASDARRLRMQALDGSIGDPMRMLTRPGASLADCRSLLRLSKEEYGDELASSAARLYYDAFQISASHSDRARASVFAERAYKARVICEGEDSPSTQRMKRFMEDPTSHKTFGAYSSK